MLMENDKINNNLEILKSNMKQLVEIIFDDNNFLENVKGIVDITQSVISSYGNSWSGTFLKFLGTRKRYDNLIILKENLSRVNSESDKISVKNSLCEFFKKGGDKVTSANTKILHGIIKKFSDNNYAESYTKLSDNEKEEIRLSFLTSLISYSNNFLEEDNVITNSLNKSFSNSTIDLNGLSISSNIDSDGLSTSSSFGDLKKIKSFNEIGKINLNEIPEIDTTSSSTEVSCDESYIHVENIYVRNDNENIQENNRNTQEDCNSSSSSSFSIKLSDIDEKNIETDDVKEVKTEHGSAEPGTLNKTDTNAIIQSNLQDNNLFEKSKKLFNIYNRDVCNTIHKLCGYNQSLYKTNSDENEKNNLEKNLRQNLLMNRFTSPCNIAVINFLMSYKALSGTLSNLDNNSNKSRSNHKNSIEKI